MRIDSSSEIGAVGRQMKMVLLESLISAQCRHSEELLNNMEF